LTAVDDFSHVDRDGRVRMVDVSCKQVVKRTAVARGFIGMAATTVDALRGRSVAKGDVLTTAKLAGIMAAKRTGDLIPLCHPLPIDDVRVELDVEDGGVRIEAAVVSIARTGVEMEALTAVSVAALTIYDMCKAVDREMVIGDIALQSKTKEPP
jgi:cyclic pyranopterin phosphate synthase